MNRIVSAVLCLVLALSVCVFSCAEEAGFTVVALKGPTAMGMVKMMDENTVGASFELQADPQTVSPLVIQGAVDIAAVPANLAAVLYQKTQGAIQVIGINTLGVIYIVESGSSIQSLADLQGKTIYASGQGSTPEYALNYLLSTAGVEANIEWKSEHAECLSALLSDEAGIAMLPQPFVTTALAKAKQEGKELRVALDLTAEWDALQAGKEEPSAMITGVVIAQKAFIEAHPDQLAAFLAAYRDSVDFVQNNVDAAAELVAGLGIVPSAAVASQALPACNIVLIEGEEMQQKLSGYLSELFAQNPAAVGGALPAEDFYYIAK